MKKFLTILLAMLCLLALVLFASCDKDGDETETPPVCEHAWGEWELTTAPACKPGVETQTCSLCGEEETREVAATGVHVFDDWQILIPSTCIELGTQKHICTVCGIAETTDITKYGVHKFNDTECVDCGLAVTLGLEFVDLGLNYAVVGIGEAAAETDIVVPAIHNGKAVIGISKDAFAGNTTIKSIILPTSVIWIEDNAFNGCTAMTSVLLSTELYRIEDAAFANCTALEAITMPYSLRIIGANAFKNCSALDKVYVNNLSAWCKNVTFRNAYSNPLSNGAKFYLNGTQVTTLEIPTTITSIAAYSFYGCAGLTKVQLHDLFTSVGTGALAHCPDLVALSTPGQQIPKTVTNEDGTTSEIMVDPTYRSIGNCLITTSNKYVAVGCKASVIPADGAVLGISGNAFLDCVWLENINIPAGVTTISGSAFAGCTNLRTVTIASSVTSIGSAAFTGCGKIESMTIPFVGNTPTTVNSYGNLFGYIFGTGAYEGSFAAPQVYLNSSNAATAQTYYIPETLRAVTVLGGNIYYGAFSGCEPLTTLVLPATATTIGFRAMEGCTNLQTLTVPMVNTENTHFGYMFGAASYAANSTVLPPALTTVIINGGTEIADYAFFGCVTLQEVQLLGNIATIGEYAFVNCSGMTNLVLGASVTDIKPGAFSGCIGMTTLNVLGEGFWNVCEDAGFAANVTTLEDGITVATLNNTHSGKFWKRTAEALQQPTPEPQPQPEPTE
ncbi:MAG: leucine-rich repeat domain-containing protein [Clostridia bacterium]|nr:leucine-rich repeat domain-containing protein [Clostridia bacterium]